MEFASTSASASATSPLDELVRKLIEKIGSSVAACASDGGASSLTSNRLVEVLPEFSGGDLEDDAKAWCDLVEQITEKQPDQQRLSLATHALKGTARVWYQGWKGQPRTWAKFREDLSDVFVTKKNLHERLSRAIAYTSDSATTYAAYARTKLLYLEQARVAFTTDDLIELVIGAITDENVRQTLYNGQYKETAQLISGLSQFTKSVRGKRTDQEFKEQLRKPRETGKRCFTCGSVEHLQVNCPKRRKSSTGDEMQKKVVPTCKFCSKRGHEEIHCWAKQRVQNKPYGHKKPEVNLCVSNDCNTTPILIKDTLLHCLLDSGAGCSLIKETVAKRACVKVEPHFVTVQGLGCVSVTTVGRTSAVVQSKDIAVELDLFVLKDSDMLYDVVIGRNILKHGDLRMETDASGSRLQQTVPANPENLSAFSCNVAKVTCEEARGPLEELLSRYQHLTTAGETSRCVTTGELKILTRGDQVVNYHPYRLSYAERDKVRAIIDDLLCTNIIRESISQYASPIILVKKKNGQYRMCVDYRALNRMTVKDRYPLPLIDDQLDRLGRGKYFTILDMASGFHQIPVAEDSIEKTAFVTPDGHYEYLRMPFGLCNAPAVFQRAINKALGNLRNTIALVYLDDVLIPSQSIQEGLQNLESVLQALSVAGFTLNMEKCKFFQKTIEYLGREVSGDGIRPGKEKVKALLESPIPTNVKQVRQFIGLASYFRKFIPEFAFRTACIHKLLKKGQSWSWGPEQDAARRYILDKLSTQPMLTVFDPSRETELHTDASSVGYGAILLQKVQGDLRVVAYFSRRTTPEESRYHSYELETLAIVNALKYFRVYLIGITFKIVTDCNAVKASSKKKDLLPRIARWWVYLQDFTFELEYRKGKRIEHVDFLSRNPPKDYRVNVICEGSWLEVAQKNDEDTKALIDRVRADESVTSDYALRDNILCRKIQSDKGRVIYRNYVPKGSRIGLLRLYHDENSHVGSEKTYDCISRKYWFPRMRYFVGKYIKHCITCTVSKRHSGPRQGLLFSIKKTPIPFDTLHGDCVGPFDESKGGYKHIMLLVDAFTKYLQLVPLKSLTGAETLQVFRERLTLFGTPRQVVLDRGTNFTYRPLKAFLEDHGVKLHFIATGAPRANGQAERYVSTVVNLLTTELSQVKDWPNKLASIQLSLNTTVQKSTGFSPSRLLFGIERSAGNAVLAERELPDVAEEINLNQDRALAAERLLKNADAQNKNFNKKRRNNITYELGDTVFVRPADTRRAKLDAKFLGPFSIIKKLDNDRFEIMGKSGNPQTVPKDRLRLWGGEWSGDADFSSEDEPC